MLYLSNGNLWSSGDLTYVSAVRMLYKQRNKLATYECDKLQKNMRAECTPGSRLSVIDLSSHVAHVIITRILFTLARTTIREWNNLPLEIAMFI